MIFTEYSKLFTTYTCLHMSMKDEMYNYNWLNQKKNNKAIFVWDLVK
jgi:hypothetical protein